MVQWERCVSAMSVQVRSLAWHDELKDLALPDGAMGPGIKPASSPILVVSLPLNHDRNSMSVYIYVTVQQKLTQYCKSALL